MTSNYCGVIKLLDVTEKVHVLAVLEDGSFHDAHEVKALLEENFDLDSGLDAVRKHLERCFDQKLVTREKNGRRYRYRIIGKGRERLKRMRAKRRKETAVAHGKFTESVKLQRQIKYKDLIPHLLTPIKIAMANMISTNKIPAKCDDFDASFFLPLARRRREEGEYVLYRLEQEQKEKETYKKKYLEEKLKREGLEKELERSRACELEAHKEGFRLGRKVGKLEAETHQVIKQGKNISSLLQERMLKKQKREEALQAILLRQSINCRWYDLLPRGSGNKLPLVEGPAHGS